MNATTAFISILVVMIVSMSVQCLVTIPGGYRSLSTDPNHPLKNVGQAYAMDTPQLHAFVITMTLAIFLCLGVAMLHMLVDLIVPNVWRIVSLFTMFVSVAAVWISGAGILQIIDLIVGDEQRFSVGAKVIGYATMTFFTIAMVVLLCLFHAPPAP